MRKLLEHQLRIESIEKTRIYSFAFFKVHSLVSRAIRFRIQGNAANKMPIVYWVRLQREVSTYERQYST